MKEYTYEITVSNATETQVVDTFSEIEKLDAKKAEAVMDEWLTSNCCGIDSEDRMNEYVYAIRDIETMDTVYANIMQIWHVDAEHVDGRHEEREYVADGIEQAMRYMAMDLEECEIEIDRHEDDAIVYFDAKAGDWLIHSEFWK